MATLISCKCFKGCCVCTLQDLVVMNLNAIQVVAGLSHFTSLFEGFTYVYDISMLEPFFLKSV